MTDLRAVEIEAILAEMAVQALVEWLDAHPGTREEKLVEASRLLDENSTMKDTLTSIAAVALVNLSEKEKT